MPLSLKHVKDGEICPCAKFCFNFIVVTRNIANKQFSLKKALDPGLKHLEISISLSLKVKQKLSCSVLAFYDVVIHVNYF